MQSWLAQAKFSLELALYILQACQIKIRREDVVHSMNHGCFSSDLTCCAACSREPRRRMQLALWSRHSCRAALCWAGRSSAASLPLVAGERASSCVHTAASAVLAASGCTELAIASLRGLCSSTSCSRGPALQATCNSASTRLLHCGQKQLALSA